MSLEDKAVTIIGAGIGGLTTAIALARRGAHVTVLEQADAIREVGAGIQVSPNGVHVLAELGLAGKLNGIATRGERVSLKDGHDGTEVAGLDLTRLAPDQSYFFVHRADMIEMLADAARDYSIEIRLNAAVSEVSSDALRAQYTLASGEQSETDLLIGADGLRSVVRPHLNGRAVPFFTRQVAWRALVPMDSPPPNVASVYMGPGRHAVTYPLRDGALMNVVAVEERPGWTDEGWHHQDDPANMRAAFAGACPELTNLLAQVETCHIWGLFRHKVAESWHRDRLAILGDAVHPTLPFLAQGAVMAMEDAWVLAHCLSNGTDIPEALAQYQTHRHARVTRVINAANSNARNYHLRSPLIRGVAHAGLRMISRTAPGLLLRKFDWLYRYDVTNT